MPMMVTDDVDLMLTTQISAIINQYKNIKIRLVHTFVKHIMKQEDKLNAWNFEEKKEMRTHTHSA